MLQGAAYHTRPLYGNSHYKKFWLKKMQTEESQREPDGFRAPPPESFGGGIFRKCSNDVNCSRLEMKGSSRPSFGVPARRSESSQMFLPSFADERHRQGEKQIFDCALSIGVPALCEREEEKFPPAALENNGGGMHKFKLQSLTRLLGNDSDLQIAGNSVEKTVEAEFSDGSVTRTCSDCKTDKTPLWRNGPNGPKSLCNACGIRYKKIAKQRSASNGDGGMRKTPTKFPSSVRQMTKFIKRKRDTPELRSQDPAPQLPQTQQQQLEQSPVKPQQQHLQQLQQSQQHLQQPQQQQQHSQNFPLQPQQQYAPQSQQQPQQSSLQPQHQHLQPLSQHQLQQLPLQPQQQHLPQPQQQTQQQLQQPSIQPQQQQLQLLSQHQQQSQQLPLQPQEQHLPQSQQKPQQQLQQSPLPSQHQHSQQLLQSQQQPSLQQAPLPSQQQHLQQLAQSQQQPQQLSLQQQQQHLQQSQQQPQQHLQQSSMSSHQQPQQQLPQPQQQLPHPQQQHLQQLPQPQKQHLQQLPQPQQQRSQALPQSQQQLQQPQPQQQRSQQLSQSQHQLQQQQLQPHLQQLSQSQQQLQQKQLQPQVQQQQQQLNNQQPSQPAVGQATTSVRGQNTSGSHSISFGSLIPMILPHLSREQSDRLQGLYTRLRRNEVTKEDFLRATRNVVGDQMLVQAVRQMQQKHQAQSQAAPSSQANQLQQQQQQQQQQRQQQHAQGSSQQFMPQQNIHTQQLNEPQPFQQVSPANLQQQTQRTSDYQPNSQSSAPATLTASHPSSDNKTQQSRQSGEQRPEVSSVHGNQTVTMNLHSVKHEVDRTMIGFPISNQQQQQHLQVPPSSFPMYGRTPGNYSSQSFSVSPGIPPSGVKALAQDSQTKQVMHSQVGVQAQGGPSQLSSIKNMPKYDLSKQSKRREDEDRQKILQSSGASHFSGQHQPSVWATSLDKEKAGNTGISPSSSVHIKQEINDNSDQQHNVQTLQPIDHGQSLISTKTESVEHQSIKTSSMSSGNLSIVNHPLGSTGVHSDHLMQAPLATSAAALHHTLSAFGGPVTGNPLQGQLRTQVPSTPPSSVVGSQIKTPPKKTLIGQKKPLEVTGPSMQLASKKQKVSAGYLDQSIDQLNDVTAVSGVNLREEEEQLFAGPKEESRATEAMRKVVQEEEERTFLQKGSLRAKLAGIMAKYGIKYISSDSERCLSLCVEERLRTMIGHLIRLSKQRVDLERVSHKVTITSDVRRQILAMNKKAKDDLEKKQAEEAEKLRKLNEIENVGPEGEKDETRTKAQKAQKEEDDKMRANAANVAARAAVGGDDMLSKWQLMAEQARQKREGTSDGASNNRTNRDANRKSVVGGLKSANVSDHQDAPSPGMVRNLGRTSGPSSQAKPVRSICIKDVIALLEREPQMTKSTLLYRLYERGVDCSKEKVTESQNNENSLQ